MRLEGKQKEGTRSIKRALEVTRHPDGTATVVAELVSEKKDMQRVHRKLITLHLTNEERKALSDELRRRQ